MMAGDSMKVLHFLKLAVFTNISFWVTSSAAVRPISLSGAFTSNGSLTFSDRQGGKQDPASFHIALTPTLTIYDQINLPFELYISNTGRGYRQPFNQFGASPQIGSWLTLHGGYFNTQLTDLSFGDTRLLGGGVDIHPTWFRLVALYGRSQKAQASDTVAGIHGLYDRYVAAGMIGVGSSSRNHFFLTIMRAIDDTGSFHDQHLTGDNNQKYYYGPKENLVSTASWSYSIIENRLTWGGEIAGSAFTNDINDSAVYGSALPSWLTHVFTPRNSSQFDMAAKTQILWAPRKDFQLGLNSRWIGPGYFTLGYNGMSSDLFDITLAPQLRISGSKYQIRPSFGVRFNNLYGTRIARTTRTIGSLNAIAQPSQALGFDLQYSNYGTRSNARSDTLRISTIAQSLTVTPHYTFSRWGAMQTTSISYSLQSFTDQNVVSASLDKYSVNSVNGIWNQTWPSTLTLTSNAIFVRSTTALLSTSIYGLNENIAHSFLVDNALSVALNAGYNFVHTIKSDGQLTAGTTVSYNIKRAGVFSLILSSNRYDYGTAGTVPSFQEFQGSLNYTISF